MFNQSIYIFDLILETQMVLYFEQKGDGFLLVYSVTDPKSFENIRKIYDKILSVKAGVTHLMILVGNKVDLVFLRKVTEEQGREMAVQLNV
jgi:Ras-related protein M-Ras